MTDPSAASLEFAHGCRWPDSCVDLARLIDDAITARSERLAIDGGGPVEIMARTMRDKYAVSQIGPTPSWEHSSHIWLPLAGAVCESLREAGFKVLPREATEGMVKAGREFTIEAIWQAMWDCGMNAQQVIAQVLSQSDFVRRTEAYTTQADRIVEALLKSGLKVLAREPDAIMHDAAIDAENYNFDTLWRAMWDAAEGG